MNAQCCADMWKFLVRNVEIQISNTTQDITLENPRTYFYSGYSSNPPGPSVPPGSSDTFQFCNPPFWGCSGILVYEVTTFTLAIYFSNPLNYTCYSIELGLKFLEPEEVEKLRSSNLQTALKEIYKSMSTLRDKSYHPVTVGICQKPAQVSEGHIKVVATMSNDRRSVIRIVVEEQEVSGMEPRRETRSQ